MRFYKYHGLGNDYIVLDPAEIGSELTGSQIKKVCHRNYGVGSDGILFGPFEDPEGDVSLRIFNPDGSEAEKSGNGLRIFARYLFDKERVSEKPFTVSTMGGKVCCQVLDGGKNVTVDMGEVSFESGQIPVDGPAREVINEKIILDGEELVYCAATIGNPHCVILRDKARADEAKKWGPTIENDSRFPNRTNVQFMEIIDRENIFIEIWERGAGYTLASGSSSSASAAVAHRLGLCDAHILVHMPGGNLEIDIQQNYAISMSGAVKKIASGRLFPEMFEISSKLI